SHPHRTAHSAARTAVFKPLDARPRVASVAGFFRTTVALSRERFGPAVATIGNQAFFAGGNHYAGNDHYLVSDAVDIYDGGTGRWSTAHLSLGRQQIVTATVGDQVLFIGGLAADQVISD